MSVGLEYYYPPRHPLAQWVSFLYDSYVEVTMEILAVLGMLVLFIVRELKRPIVEKHTTEIVRREVVVERPSFLLEGDVVDLDELLVYLVTKMQDSGAVAQEARFAKAWVSFITRHIDPKYPVGQWLAPTPAIWVGASIPEPLVLRLEAIEAAHNQSVLDILSQEG